MMTSQDDLERFDREYHAMCVRLWKAIDQNVYALGGDSVDEKVVYRMHQAEGERDEARTELARLRGIRRQQAKQIGRLKARIRQGIAGEIRYSLSQVRAATAAAHHAEAEVDSLLEWMGYEEPPTVTAG